jgi:hypothetical protein
MKAAVFVSAGNTSGNAKNMSEPVKDSLSSEIIARRAMILLVCCAVLIAGIGSARAQVIQDGTKVRVRLDQQISSATADQWQTVELTAAEAVKVDEVVVIPEGARVIGTVTEAQEKRRMGRAGKLDFSIDRVRAADGEWIPLRYSVQKKSGESHAVRTGIITAGVAAVFWPAAPVMLLMKGKDITINKGMTFDVFTDTAHVLQNGHSAFAAVTDPSISRASAATSTAGGATVTITASIDGADIEIDGSFVGNTPTTVQLQPGSHQVTVKAGALSWHRIVQVSNGNTISLTAVLTRQTAGMRDKQ